MLLPEPTTAISEAGLKPSLSAAINASSRYMATDRTDIRNFLRLISISIRSKLLENIFFTELMIRIPMIIMNATTKSRYPRLISPGIMFFSVSRMAFGFKLLISSATSWATGSVSCRISAAVSAADSTCVSA